MGLPRRLRGLCRLLGRGRHKSRLPRDGGNWAVWICLMVSEVLNIGIEEKKAWVHADFSPVLESILFILFEDMRSSFLLHLEAFS